MKTSEREMRWGVESGGLFGLLQDAAERNPDGVYLVGPERTWTYGEVREAACRLAGWWKGQGIVRGDRVVICCRNRAEIAIGVYAAALAGAVFVVLNSRLRPHGLAKILVQAEPSAVLADEATAEIFDGLPLPEARIHVGGAEVPEGWRSWEEAMGAEAVGVGSWPGIDVDPVSLVFTSGSTADPRGVTLSHHNIVFVTGAIQRRLGYRAGDVVGCFLPLAFDYGLYQVFLAARAGAALLVGDPSQVGPLLPKILRDGGVSVLPGVPTIYAALISLHGRRPFELPLLRVVTNTGERLPLAYIGKLEAMFPGVEVYPMYGLTECKRVSILLPHERRERPDSVGRPLDGTEVYAVGADGERLPSGEVGELVVRGRHVAHGYWRAPEETGRRFRKRAPEAAVELFTGDRGSVDAEGFIYFAARADDLIKHRGNRMSPVEIEMEACGVPGVVEASVVKREADDTLHLFVTVSDPGLGAVRVLGELAEKLEAAKVPDFVHVEAELPKSLNGKIDRKSLLVRAGEIGTEENYETVVEASSR